MNMKRPPVRNPTKPPAQPTLEEFPYKDLTPTFVFDLDEERDSVAWVFGNGNLEIMGTTTCWNIYGGGGVVKGYCVHIRDPSDPCTPGTSLVFPTAEQAKAVYNALKPRTSDETTNHES